MIKKYVYNYILDEGIKGEDEGHIIGHLNHCPEETLLLTPEEEEDNQNKIIERLKKVIVEDMKERFADYFEYKKISNTEIEAIPSTDGKTIDFTLSFCIDGGCFEDYYYFVFITLFWLH